MSKRINTFILAAGIGSRLRPITDRIPKCLVPIAGRPLLDYWVDAAARLGVVEARVNTHAHADQVAAFIRATREAGRLNMTEFREPTLLGSAGTIAANPDFADGVDEVVLIYADNLSNVDLSELVAFHRSHEDPFTIMLMEAENPRACGIVEIDERGRVHSFEEKPANPKGNLANAGIYVLDADAYREIAAARAFDLGFDILPKFVGRMRGWTFDGYHRDVGTHEALRLVTLEAPRIFPARRRISGSGRKAVFLDRDGTLIEHVHYLSHPSQVRLVPEGAESVRRLREAGFACVVVTNQSVVGKGIITESDLASIHDEMNRQLAHSGAELDAIYFCPEAGSGSDRTAVEHPDRKPGPGMLLRAASEHGLDLGASWMVGDMVSDVLAGVNAGCRGSILLSSDSRSEIAGLPCTPAADLRDAANLILRAENATR